MEPFEYIITLISIIIGLGITQLLIGVSRIVYNPKGVKLYWIHLLWTFSILIYLISFWWFEATLVHTPEWTFQLYLFIILYAILIFSAAIINMPFYFPENFKDYYYVSRKWFFGIFIAINVVDVLDTLIKGWDHFNSLGLGYVIFILANFILGLLALFTRKEMWHGIIAFIYAVYQIWYLITSFNTLPM